jgi:hypothetical protein
MDGHVGGEALDTEDIGGQSSSEGDDVWSAGKQLGGQKGPKANAGAGQASRGSEPESHARAQADWKAGTQVH